MPAFDGTGPQGQGPLTGRGMGRCGKGRCLGRGKGLGRFFGGSPTRSKTDLENYKKALKEEIEDVEKEIETKVK